MFYIIRSQVEQPEGKIKKTRCLYYDGGNVYIGNTVTNVVSNFSDQTGIGLSNSATVPYIEESSEITSWPKV